MRRLKRSEIEKHLPDNDVKIGVEHRLESNRGHDCCRVSPSAQPQMVWHRLGVSQSAADRGRVYPLLPKASIFPSCNPIAIFVYWPTFRLSFSTVLYLSISPSSRFGSSVDIDGSTQLSRPITKPLWRPRVLYQSFKCPFLEPYTSQYNAGSSKTIRNELLDKVAAPN